LTNSAYANIWASDDLRYTRTAGGNGEYALLLFRLKIGIQPGGSQNEPRSECLKRIFLVFEGFGLASQGNGVTLKVWDNAAVAWSLPLDGVSATDQTLTILITKDVANYVNDNGYVYLLARTTNPSNGVSPAVLHCDFMQVTIDVRGITFCDVHSFRDVDVVDVKPFIYKEEIQLVAWLFESVATS
jgi:hypothetical protein